MHILIADDHPLIRQGLKQLLADELGPLRIGEAGTTAETLALLRQEPWDVLILDINMPGRGGLEVLLETSANFPRLPVLVLSSTPEDQLGLRVLKAGAAGYVNKVAAPEELAIAVRKVMAGGRYVSGAFAEKLAEEVRRGAKRPPHELLSTREHQVLGLMAAGKSLKQIAGELSLSVKTISTFRSRVFEKLGVQNDVEMVRYTIEHGIGAEKPSGDAPPS